MELVDKVHTKMSYQKVLGELVEKVHACMAFKEHGEVVVLFDGFVIPRIVVPKHCDDVSEDSSMPELLPRELDEDSDDEEPMPSLIPRNVAEYKEESDEDSMHLLIPRIVVESKDDSDDDSSMPKLIPRTVNEDENSTIASNCTEYQDDLDEVEYSIPIPKCRKPRVPTPVPDQKRRVVGNTFEEVMAARKFILEGGDIEQWELWKPLPPNYEPDNIDGEPEISLEFRER